MNTIWLKIAAAAVAVVIAIIVVGRFSSDKPAPSEPEKQKTFYDMADRDKQFNEPPKPVEEPPAQPAQEPAPQPAPQPEPQPAPQPPVQQTTPVPTMARPAGVVFPSDLTGPTKLYFMPMSEEDDIAAQQILPYATAGRSIGRLPVMQYGLMNEGLSADRGALARQLVCLPGQADDGGDHPVPDRYAQRYKITPQRLDISRFMKPRQGTEPATVEPIRR